jgi:hypothetical protein
MSLPNELLPVGLLATGAVGGYEIERSLRFNSADSAYLSRTPASVGNRKTWTWAGWVKRSAAGEQMIFYRYLSAGNGAGLNFESNDTLQLVDFTSSIPTFRLNTSAVFRDYSAWYHIVAAVDTANATSSSRVKLYINGLEITAFATATYPSQNFEGYINQAALHTIGRRDYSPSYAHYSGYLADIHFIDGQALDPTSFGEFDENGIWQPVEYTGEYGTNGFHLPFSDNSSASALGTDTSGNENDWTVNNIIAGPTTVSNSWSGYFDGSGDYLTTPSNSAFDFGSGSFTVECWIYRKSSGYQAIVGTRTGDTTSTIRWGLFVDTSNVLSCNIRDTSNNDIASINHQTTISLDTWNHCVLVRDGTSFRLYLNGVQSTSGTTSSAAVANSSTVVRIGDFDTSIISDMNGYISNLRIVKGTAVYTSSFTPPTSPLTAITNTSLLTLQNSTFIDNSTNNFTITVNGNARVDFRSPFEESVDTDSFVDVPTNGTQTDTGLGGEVRGNYCTLNPLKCASGITLSNGNLDFTLNASLPTFNRCDSTVAVNSGKWYVEFDPIATTRTKGFGIIPTDTTSALTADIGNSANAPSNSAYCLGIVGGDLTTYKVGSTSTPTTYTAGDIIQLAFDSDSGKIWFGKNNTWFASGDPANGTNPWATLTTGGFFSVFAYIGDGGSGSGGQYGVINFGQRAFAYQAPEGFKALNTANLPTPTILDGSDYMDVVTYTGNGSTQTISGLEFSPDLVWIKNRAQADNHKLLDTVRGATNELESNTTDSEVANGDGLTAFNSNGFALGADDEYNTNNEAYVAWAWDAGSSTVTNTDGTITSSVRANPSAGFSIVTYTGNGTNGATIGHGLNVSPSLIILKSRDTQTINSSWAVWHTSLGTSQYLTLNATDAVATDAGAFTSTRPTSTVFSVGTYQITNTSSKNYVAYCFAPVSSYSSFGSYTGNGSSTDGPFVYLPFRPKYVLVKASSAVDIWNVVDSVRDPYNAAKKNIWINQNSAEDSTTAGMDLLSNGFKPRNQFNYNGSGVTYIYAAFAENPFSVARAR